MNTPETPAKTAFVLASKSAGRLQTLRSAGIDPLVRVSSVDEDEVTAALPADTSAEALVVALAAAKAQDVAQRLLAALKADPDSSPWGSRPAVVLGADSMLELGGKLVGKPHTPEVATERIKQMRGRDGVLWSGHALMLLQPPVASGEDPGELAGWTLRGPFTAASSTIVHFGDITDAEIEAYVATGEPLQVAGSFTIDGLGGPFITGVTGDPSSVVGIGLPLVRQLAKQAGVFWPDLWTNQGPQAPSA